MVLCSKTPPEVTRCSESARGQGGTGSTQLPPGDQNIHGVPATPGLSLHPADSQAKDYGFSSFLHSNSCFCRLAFVSPEWPVAIPWACVDSGKWLGILHFLPLSKPDRPWAQVPELWPSISSGWGGLLHCLRTKAKRLAPKATPGVPGALRD